MAAPAWLPSTSATSRSSRWNDAVTSALEARQKSRGRCLNDQAALTGGDGRYHLTGCSDLLPNRPLAHASCRPAAYDGFEIKPNQDISGIDVELTNQLTTVVGVVKDTRGDAVKRYIAVAFSQDRGSGPIRATR